MGFIQFKKLIQKNFKQITKEEFVFETNVDKDTLWNLYLDSFPEGTNKVFRERREYDCSCCRQFVKNIGGAVVVKDNQLVSLWEIETGDNKYQPVIDALAEYVKSKPIVSVYINKETNVGAKKNFERLEDGKVLEWDHFYLDLPQHLIQEDSESIATTKGEYKETVNVFKRSLSELTEDSVLTVLELIAQNSLYRGEEWKNSLSKFLSYKQNYDQLATEEEKNNFVWSNAVRAGGSVSRIRNHSIGTLLVDISKGVDLDRAVRSYEKIVAPSNYRRPKAIYTKQMLEQAQQTVQELGYGDSLQRRFAVLDDISVNNILFSNRDVVQQISGLDIFEQMKESLPIDPKTFSKVEEVTIENFVDNILPSVQELEVLLEDKHTDKLVSLIAPQNKEAKSMFKWDNPFSWAYTGNITDSSISERVKSAGGKVDGVLRFSIQWNDKERPDKNDLDAHCITPGIEEIYFGNKRCFLTKGELDVDIINPSSEPAVENITWESKETMAEGDYEFFVHNYRHEGGRDGFRAEIEFDGQIHSFDYSKDIKYNESVMVATVNYSKKNGFTIKKELDSEVSSNKIWGVSTNQFIPVSVVMFSPNYWDEQRGIGNKHYMFMLKDLISEEKPNPFFNEFLSDKLRKHGRVFEALGSQLAIEDCENQLSGIGFSSTQRAELIVRAKGKVNRILKVKI